MPRARIDREAVREMYLRAGETGQSVARHFHCSKTYIYELVSDLKKPRLPPENAWPEVEIEKLRGLWGTMSTRKIAEVMGRTKSACIGIAHRNNFPNLGNPVKAGRPKNDPNARPLPPQRVRCANITLKQGNHARALSGTAQYEARRRAALREPFLPLPEPVAKTPANVQPREVPEVSPLLSVSGTLQEPRVGSVPLEKVAARGCLWPVTPHNAKQHLFCNAPQDGESPYCAHHHEKAVIRKVETTEQPLGEINNWSTAARRVA